MARSEPWYRNAENIRCVLGLVRLRYQGGFVLNEKRGELGLLDLQMHEGG